MYKQKDMMFNSLKYLDGGIGIRIVNDPNNEYKTHWIDLWKMWHLDNSFS